MGKKFKMERWLSLCWNGDYFILLHAYPYNLEREDYGEYEWRYKLNPDDKEYYVIPRGNSYESFCLSREIMKEVGKTIYVYCHVICESNEFDTELTCICEEDTFDSQLLRNTFEIVDTFDEKGNGNKMYKIDKLWKDHKEIIPNV